MKKIIIIALAVVVLVGGFFYIRSRLTIKTVSAAQASLKTATLELGNLSATISATGKVRSSQTASLVWQTSGIIENISVKTGDKVQAGQKLATLQQTSLPQSVILAQSDLFNAQQALDDLTTSAETSRIKAMQDIVTYEQAVKDAQYTLDNFTTPTSQSGMDAVEAIKVTKESLDRARLAFEPFKFKPSSDKQRTDLLETLNLAQSDYNTAVKRLGYEYDLEVAQANLTNAQADYEKWKNGPDPAEVEAMKAKIAAAQATQRQAWIEAPFAGTITQVDAHIGDQVAVSKAAFRMDDLAKLYVDLDVSEVDIDQIAVGQEVSVSFDALRGKQYAGQVSDVAMISADSSSAVNFIVTVELTDPDKNVRPGMTSQVEIVTAQHSQALLIPNQAVRVENGKQVVYVMQPDGSIKTVEVGLGISSDAFSELLNGDLKAGDQVVLNPTSTTATTATNPRRMMFFGGGGGGGGGESPNGGNTTTKSNNGQ
jgi:HlyD family secretion protein